MTHDERGAWLFGATVLRTYVVYLGSLVTTDVGTFGGGCGLRGGVARHGGAAILAGIILWIPARARGETDGETFRDARDEAITAHGERAGQGVVALAAMGALGLAAGSRRAVLDANLLYLGFMLAALVSSLARIATYRWGVPNSWWRTTSIDVVRSKTT